MKFEVNATCIGCGKCTKDCPMWLLKLVDGKPVVREGKEAGCIDCQHCVAVCPRGAITLNGVGADDCVPTDLMAVPPPGEVANLLRTRRSIRQYVQENIPRGEIEDLLETLKYVPTGCNIRHLVFKVVDDKKKLADCRQKIMELLAANLDKLPEMLQNITKSWQKNPASDAIFRGAPHVLIVYGDPKAVTPQVDCDAACAYFDILAQAHGIGTTWFGFLSHIFAVIPEAADRLWRSARGSVPRDALRRSRRRLSPLCEPFEGCSRRMAVTKRLLQLAVGLALPWCVGGKTVYDAGLYAQIPLRDITDANRAQYLADVRAAGVETVLISFLEFFEQGEARRPTLTKLASEIAFFEKAGVPAMVWINGFGYGDDRTKTPDGRARFKDSQVLVGVDGRSNGALCPLDPAHRAYLLEFVRDVAAAGAKFILMDDDYVQSARGRLGCACSRHLARVSAKCGHTVTREEVCASFTGKPNAVRTAFVDTTGEVSIELAREMRATVDAVNPSVGMGLCLSYTHWDIEGADMKSLLGAFAGSENGEAASCRFTTTQDSGQDVKRRDAASPLRRKVVRLSGAPYWGDRRFNGMGLEGFIECLRLQGEWTRGKGWTVFDENDPYPRKVAKVPAWRCELYDKATIADGLVARHKYMFCYGPDRAEPGYLEAHLANLPDDARLRRLFANTEPYGVHVSFPQRQIREAALPTEFVGEDRLTGLMSQPFGAVLLLRSGIPVRYTPADDAYTLDVKALGIDLWNLDYLAVKPEDYRQKILDAAAGGGKPVAVHVETSSRRIYQIVRYNPEEKSYSVLLENMGDTSADVKIVAKGTVKILDSLRGDFKVVPEGVALSDFPAHAWSVVKFSL